MAGPRAKPLRAMTFGECHVVVSHRLNADGYFRKRWVDGFEMFHRAIWKHHNGEIPEGFEVDHVCGNRACFNIKHFCLLGKSEHKTVTNLNRYRERFEKAKSHWLSVSGEITGSALGKLFGVTPGCACGWIKGWRNESLLTT